MERYPHNIRRMVHIIPHSGIKASKNKPSAFKNLAWFGTNAPNIRVSPSSMMTNIQSRINRIIFTTTYRLLKSIDKNITRLAFDDFAKPLYVVYQQFFLIWLRVMNSIVQQYISTPSEWDVRASLLNYSSIECVGIVSSHINWRVYVLPQWSRARACAERKGWSYSRRRIAPSFSPTFTV